MTGHQGSCHCGAIRLELAETPQMASECNCSLCRRLSSLWHYGEAGTLVVTGELEGYVQGDCTLTTWRCKTCGCVTHWTPLDEELNRVGVNLRNFDPEIWRDLPRRLIDGASY